MLVSLFFLIMSWPSLCHAKHTDMITQQLWIFLFS